jgi:hypothetical protein
MASPAAVLAGDDAEAVVLDLVQPRLATGRLRRFGGQAWRDEAEREGHDPAIGRWRGACQRHSSDRAPAVDMARAATETGCPCAPLIVEIPTRWGALHEVGNQPLESPLVASAVSFGWNGEGAAPRRFPPFRAVERPLAFQRLAFVVTSQLRFPLLGANELRLK